MALRLSRPHDHVRRPAPHRRAHRRARAGLPRADDLKRLPRAVRRAPRTIERPAPPLPGPPHAASSRASAPRGTHAAADVPALFLAVAAQRRRAARGRAARAGAAQLRRASRSTSSARSTPPRRCSRPRRRLDPHRRARREQPRARSRAAAARQRRRRRPARAGRAPRCKPLAARAEASPQRAKPVEGLRLSLCMIVKDEEEMLAALPRRREAARRRDDRRRHRLDRPHRRDRRVVRRDGARTTSGPALLRRPQRLARRRHRRLDHLPRRRRGARRRGRRAPARAHGRIWREAFYLVETNFTGDLEDGTAVPTTRCACSATAPSTASRAACTSRSPTRCPATCPSASSTRSVRIEHYGYLGVVRDAKDKSRRNLELLEQQVAEGGETPFLHFNLGSEYAAAGDAPAALDALRAVLGDARRPTRAATATRSSRRSSSRLVTRAARQRPPRRRDAHGRRGARAVPGLHRPRLRAGAGRARARRRTRGARAASSAASRWATRRRATRATVGCGTYLALIALAEVSARPAAARPRPLLDALPRRAPALPRRGPCRCAAAMLRARRASPPTSSRAIESCVAELTPSVRFMLGTALYEARRRRGRRDQFRAVLDAAARHAARARRARRGAAVAGAATPRPPRPPRRWATPSPPPAPRRRTSCSRRSCRGEVEDAARVLDARPRPARRPRPRCSAPGWRARPGGDAARARCPASRPRCWSTSLEALLRVQEVDAFGAARAAGRPRRPARRASGASCSPRCTCAAASSTPPPTSGSPSIQELGPGRARA